MHILEITEHEIVGHLVHFIRLRQDPLLFVNGFVWITFWIVMVTIWYRFIRRIM